MIVLYVLGIIFIISTVLFISEIKKAPLLDDKEPFLEDDYNPKKDPTFQEIADAIDEHHKKIKAFKEIFLENRDNLYNAATKYNECIRIYNEINQKNSKLKDLYFMVDDKFKSQLDELKTNFDSTLYFLGKLQKSLQKHPLLGYKFEYHLNPILVYRMHGLTPANFLAPTIELWDYKQWIESFNDVYKKETFYNDAVASLGFGFDFTFFGHLSIPVQFGFMGTFPDDPQVGFCGGIALRYTW